MRLARTSGKDLNVSAIRTFIAKREKDIREQMRTLRQELDELRAVRRSLELGANTPAEVQSSHGHTIKDMVKSILSKAQRGLSAQDLLVAIEAEFSAKIERTSLSPQLSRLRKDGDVRLEDGLWFPSQSFLAGWTEALSDSDILELIGQMEQPTEKAATDQ